MFSGADCWHAAVLSLSCCTAVGLRAGTLLRVCYDCAGEREGGTGPDISLSAPCWPRSPGLGQPAWQVCQVDTGTRAVSAARNGRGAVCFYKSNPWHGELIIVKMRSKYPSSRSACWWQLWGHFWQTRGQHNSWSVPTSLIYTFSIVRPDRIKFDIFNLRVRIRKSWLQKSQHRICIILV